MWHLHTAKMASLCLSITCYISFTYAILWLFKRDEKIPSTVKWLSVVGTIATFAQWAALWLLTPPLWIAVSGCFLFVACLSLFWWAALHTRYLRLGIAFAPDRGIPIQTRGPYRWVRHPFYVSYMLFWVAGALACGQPALLITLLVMCLFYFPAIRKEESELLARSDDTYKVYMARTGRLIPRVFR